MKAVKNDQYKPYSLIFDEVRQFISELLQDPVIPLITPLIQLIVDYLQFDILHPEDYSKLREELASNFPNQAKLSPIFDRINIFNLQDLDLNISYPGLELLNQLLCKNRSIIAFCFHNTRLVNRDGDQIIYLINAVLEKKPRPLLLLSLSDSKIHSLPTNVEKLLFTIVEKNHIKIISFNNMALDLKKLHKAISKNLTITSLTVNNVHVPLEPHRKYTPVTKAKRFEKMLKDLDLGNSLRLLSTPHVTPPNSYPLYDIHIEGSESKFKPMNCYDEQALLALLKKDCISSLSLINTGIRLSKVLTALSGSRHLGSLILKRPSIELKPMIQDRHIPKTESLEKIFKYLDQCPSLSEISIPRVIPYNHYKLFSQTMKNFDKTWQKRQTDIHQMGLNRVKKVFAELDHQFSYPAVLLEIILSYLFGDLTAEEKEGKSITYMNAQNWLTFTQELKSPRAQLEVLKDLLKHVNGLSFKDVEIKISTESARNLIKVLQQSPHITAFDFSNAHLLVDTIDFTNQKNLWRSITILQQTLLYSPRSLYLLDISCIDWNIGAHNEVKSETLSELLPALQNPIEFLKLTHYNYLSNEQRTDICIKSWFTQFEKSLVVFLKKDLVTHLDLTFMLVGVNHVLQAIKDCTRLRSLNLDGNIVYLQGPKFPIDTVDTVLDQLRQNPYLTTICFQKASVYNPATWTPDKLQSMLKDFNLELTKRQPEIKAIAKKNRFKLLSQTRLKPEQTSAQSLFQCS